MAEVHPARVIERSDFQLSPTAYRFEGQHYGVGVSFFWLETPPGQHVDLHTHPYDEVFVVQSGEVTFSVDGRPVKVTAGHVVTVPPGCVHGFRNTGHEALSMISIHASAQMNQTFLE